MATAPYGIRLLIGAAVTIVDETRKLPHTILTYPMTLASQAAHLVMRMQQNVADLVIRGDETLDALFPPKEEQPEWATFDEDLLDQAPSSLSSEADRERLTEGRFALYSYSGDDSDDAPADGSAKGAENKPVKKSAKPAAKAAALGTADAPDVVVELDYDSLTLAQLRSRLGSLRVAELDALLAYEAATKARAPFQTLLANRITRATVK
jgi:hypothetical protein